MVANKNSKKDIEKYTSRDIFKIWQDSYRLKRNEQYRVKMHEVALLDKLLQMYGIYEVLLCIDRSMDNMDYNIQYFYDNFDRYVTGSDYVKYHYLIKKHGTKALKHDLLRLEVLESRLLPSTIAMQKIDEIIQRFEIFLTPKKELEEYDG